MQGLIKKLLIIKNKELEIVRQRTDPVLCREKFEIGGQESNKSAPVNKNKIAILLYCLIVR